MRAFGDLTEAGKSSWHHLHQNSALEVPVDVRKHHMIRECTLKWDILTMDSGVAGGVLGHLADTVLLGVGEEGGDGGLVAFAGCAAELHDGETVILVLARCGCVDKCNL